MRLVGAACAGLLVLGACAPGSDDSPTETSDSSDTPTTQPSDSASGGQAPTKPLHDKRIVLDPGHQLGNASFPDRVNRQVPAGGFEKPCNSTGTATDDGYPEATLNWRVSTIVARELRALGADVRLTRHSNRDDRWGPCVNVRGRAGNRWHADVKVSIHADGSLSGGNGFHVIAPAGDNKWTGDIHRPSKRLAEAIRRGLEAGGFAVSDYAGENGVDVRDDLGTLNLSDVPTVMVELGNMRSDRDARLMTSATGRHKYARALVSGVRAYLGHN